MIGKIFADNDCFFCVFRKELIKEIEQFDNFEGEIDGLTVHELRVEFFKILQFKDFEARKVLIEDLLEKYDKFLCTYYSEYYDPHITTDDVTSEHNNVSKTLEMLGTILINADNEDNPYDKSYFDLSI